MLIILEEKGSCSMKRVFFAFVLMVLLISAFSVTTAQDVVTLRVMNWSQEQADFYVEVAAQFNQEYPNIVVEWTTMAKDQYDLALPLMFQSEETPDIFWYQGPVPVLTLSELLQLGWVQPMVNVPEDWASRWPEGSFVDGVNTFEGEYYSHQHYDSLIWGHGYMFYNKDLFRAAGLDPEAPPQTWGELRAACEAIRASGPYCIAMPMEPANELHRIWIPLSGSVGSSEGLDPVTGRFAYDSESNLRAFEFLQGLYQDDLIMPGLNDKAFSRSALGGGLAAIYFDGTWVPSVIRGMGFEVDLGVAIAPAPDEGRSGSVARRPLDNNQVWISSQSDYAEEATIFLEWLTRPDSYYAQQYMERGYGVLGWVSADNIENPGLRMVADTVVGSPLRHVYPEPVLQCPEIATSTALQAANQASTTNEFIEIQRALVEGTDYATAAAELSAARNDAFFATLEAEGISPECFAFPDWTYTEDYVVSLN